MTIDNAIQGLVNLASPKMGTKILAFSDDFFWRSNKNVK